MADSLSRRTILVASVGAVASLALESPARADDQPIKLLVGFAPGGTTDVLARLVATGMGAKLGRTVIVENRPGASGNLAALAVAKAPADGATLLFAPSSHATNPSLYKKLAFDTGKDFVAVGLVASTPYILVVSPQLPVKDVAGLIALLKADPGRYQYASAGQGTGQHLAAELFKKSAGVEMTQVPYKGSSAAFPDLIAGRVPIMFDNITIILPHVRSNALKPLAITSTKRSPLLPEVPTVAESLPGFDVQGWFAVLAPAKTPAGLVRELNAALNATVAEASFKKRLSDFGAEALGATSEAADKYIAQEAVRWGEVIRQGNISLD